MRFREGQATCSAEVMQAHRKDTAHLCRRVSSLRIDSRPTYGVRVGTWYKLSGAFVYSYHRALLL